MLSVWKPFPRFLLADDNKFSKSGTPGPYWNLLKKRSNIVSDCWELGKALSLVLAKNYTLIMSLSQWWFWQMYFSYQWECFASLLSWLWPGEVLEDGILTKHFLSCTFNTQNWKRRTFHDAVVFTFFALQEACTNLSIVVHESKAYTWFIVNKICRAQKLQNTCVSEWWHWANIYTHENIHAQEHIFHIRTNLIDNLMSWIYFEGGNKNFICSKVLKLD